MADIRQFVLNEAIEAAAHELVANEMRDAAAAGEGEKGIAARVLKKLVDDNGLPMRLAKSLPGFAMPVVGAALGHLIGKAEFLDKILPDNLHPAVKQAKMLLRMAGPNILTGAFAGARDAAMDIGRVHQNIDRSLNAVRSDSHVPDDQQTLKFDSVVVSRLLPDRFFEIKRLSDGTIRRGSDGVPVVNDVHWQAYKAMWDDTHKASTRMVGGGGKGQPQRPERVDAEPFPFEIVKLEDVVDRLGNGADIRAEDMVVIKKMLAKPTEWWDAVGPDVRHFFMILGRSVDQGTSLEYDIHEDIIKDVINHKGIAFLQTMAEFYNPRIVNNQLVLDDVMKIVDTFDTNMSGELTPWNKFKRSASRVWANRGSVPKSVIVSLIAMLLGISAVTILNILWFLFSIGALLYGMCMPYGRPHVMFWTGTFYQDPSFLAAVLMTVGSAMLIVQMATLQFWQGIMHPLAVKFLGAPRDWLASIGWKAISLLLLPFVFIFGALVFHSSEVVRLICVVLVGIQIPRLMILKGAARSAPKEVFKDEAELYAFDLVMFGAKWTWLILPGILFLDWLIRAGFHMIGLNAVGSAAPGVHSYLIQKDWVAAVVRMTLACVAIALILPFVEKRLGKSWITRLAAAFIVVVLTFYPWFSSFGSSSSSGATSTVTAPVTTPTPAPTPRRQRTSASGNIKQTTKVECSNLSPPGKIAAGCP